MEIVKTGATLIGREQVGAVVEKGRVKPSNDTYVKCFAFPHTDTREIWTTCTALGGQCQCDLH